MFCTIVTELANVQLRVMDTVQMSVFLPTKPNLLMFILCFLSFEYSTVFLASFTLSPLNMDTQLIQTLSMVLLVSILTEFDCACSWKRNKICPFCHRPEWDENMTAEELDQIEKESFIQWRRQLAQ